jgi:hypothetical protein
MRVLPFLALLVASGQKRPSAEECKALAAPEAVIARCYGGKLGPQATYIGDLKCWPFSKPQRLVGLWLIGLEASEFYPNDKSLQEADKRRSQVWLESPLLERRPELLAAAQPPAPANVSFPPKLRGDRVPIADIRWVSQSALMTFIRYALAATSLLVATNSALASSTACPIANIESQRELHNFLSKRAVQIVQLASRGEESRLATLVNSSAPFSLGAGDVGRPLGLGVRGAKALAAAMGADTYRYLGWDHMDGPAKPCSSQKVTVEFVDSGGKIQSQVEFTFENGLLTNASGWSRSYESGALKAETSH